MATGEPSRDVFRAPKGTRDVLPPESQRWIDVIGRFADRARRFGYGLVVTPMFEHYEVFARLGDSTDVVSKEMYDFTDKGDRRLALRPEGTAGAVRAFVEHRPTPPWKVWYCAPNFRYERPQAGRYRQHFQIGAEVIGSDDPLIDVEMIDLIAGFYRELGLARVRLVINSMGDAPSRAAYRGVLLDYWRDHQAVLGDEIARAELNPLRILDSKRPDWQTMIDAAPRLSDHLNVESARAFAAVREGLEAIGIDYDVEPRLVRGFDYYTATVFEFQGLALEGAQNGIGGGGRYDRLSEEMGGPPAPAIGFGSGIERILLALDAEATTSQPTTSRHAVDAYIVDGLGSVAATSLVHDLREQGVATDRAYGGRSLKKQWGAADKSGARFGVMLAPREFAEGRAVVKELATGEQSEVPIGEIAEYIRRQSGASSS
jgi:histidyl-tRNA synthetase